LAQELERTQPEVSAEIQRWAIHDEDLYRVTRKLSDLLDGRIKRGYDQLAHHLCRRLSERGIKRIAIEENFLKKVAEAEKKYQPVAIQRSARYRQAVGPSNMISTLEHIAGNAERRHTPLPAAVSAKPHVSSAQSAPRNALDASKSSIRTRMRHTISGLLNLPRSITLDQRTRCRKH
jgi:hypothetical protein